MVSTTGSGINQKLTDKLGRFGMPKSRQGDLDLACIRRDFENFVRQHGVSLRSTLARSARRLRVELDDTFQEGLERIWREWESWPHDINERVKYASRAMQFAAIDAVRRKYGRSGDKPRSIPIDFSYLTSSYDEPGKDKDGVDRTIAELYSALLREPNSRRDLEQIHDRSVLIEACTALEPIELKVLLRISVLGQSYREVSEELSLTTDQVTAMYFETRKVLRGLIAHAGVADLPIAERQQLYGLIDHQLRGRERRIAQRHYDHCHSCQRVASLRQSLSSSWALEGDAAGGNVADAYNS